MAIKITHDANAPIASVELTISQPLDDFDLTEVAAPIPRDIDPILASQGFKDLLDEARAILESEFSGTGLAIAQLTGAICRDAGVYHPGIWLVVRESNAAAGKEMSQDARSRVAATAESLRSSLRLS
ncbi:MAG TPA: hypothetical protein VGU63_05185 [Candidatus Acidoferrales bacterium]|nr:hypothetical protein [Candidatus Acidoferrales bacterium]